MSSDPPDEKEEKVRALDEDDIALLKTYGQGPYSQRIKDVEKDVKEIVKKVNEVSGIKESDTGLAPPSRWDLVSDKQAMQEEQPLQVNGYPALHVPLQLSPSCLGHALKAWATFLCCDVICVALVCNLRTYKIVSVSADTDGTCCRRLPGAPRSSSLAQKKQSMSSMSSR